jgi:predicted ester cyclase
MPQPHEFAALAEAAFNARDEAGLRALWTDDFHFVGPDNETRGVEAMIAREHALWSAFPDARASVRFVASGDGIAVLQTTMTGTQTGPLDLGRDPLPASGRKVEIAFSVHLHLRGDRACGERVFYDRLGMLRQLGVLLPEAA